jgi:hypothetical protein
MPFAVAVFACLAALALAAAWFPAGKAAPAPENWKLPQKKLEELTKQLPKILQDEALAKWLKDMEIRLVRLVGPEEAKVRVRVSGGVIQGQRHYLGDRYLVVRLRFYDGRWTTAGFERSWPDDNANAHLTVLIHRFMDLIDEATER